MFQEKTSLAAETMQTPIAAISFVDRDRIRFGCRYGTDIEETDGVAQDAQGIRTLEQLQQLEFDNYRLALDTADWQVSGRGGAAELLGMNPTTLSSRMKSLGIHRPR